MKSFIVVTLLASILGANCTLESIKRDDNVLVLTKDNFEEATTNTLILVEFCRFNLALLTLKVT